ncbi:MAG: hypothetical protein ACKVS8_05830 [Phycisphaerales bacterium]
MNRNLVRGVLSLVGVAGLASAANAQAPASAQVWDVQFVVDRHVPSQTDVTTLVSITMMARVSILPNGSASGTTNFGVSRVGGANGTLFIQASDTAATVDPVPSMFARGLSSVGLDAGNNPLAGHFSPFRGAFAPAGSGGHNTDASNGIFSNVAVTTSRLTSIVGSRQTNFDGSLLGVGDYVAIYTWDFIPKDAAARAITVTVSGLSGRYLFRDDRGANPVGNASAAPQVNLPNQTFQFRVPTPGAAAVLGLGGLAIARRRRA